MRRVQMTMLSVRPDRRSPPGPALQPGRAYDLDDDDALRLLAAGAAKIVDSPAPPPSPEGGGDSGSSDGDADASAQEGAGVDGEAAIDWLEEIGGLKVDEVLALVDDDPAEAADAAHAERETRQRPTLLERLDQIVAAGSDGDLPEGDE